MSVYSVYFSGSKPLHYIDEATPVTVDGVEMARMPSGTIVPLAGFYPSRSEALNAAADRMERHAKEVLEKAADIRKEAANA